MERPLAHGHFSPWAGSEGRSCRTCTYAEGFDSPHVWCTEIRVVPVFPFGLWQREPGTD